MFMIPPLLVVGKYMCRKVMRMGLMTAAALMPAKPVPSPAPMPAKNVTITVKSRVISVYLLQNFV